jgi:hypothetical protein
MDPRAKFGKATVAGAHRRPNGFYNMVRKLSQGVLRVIGLCSSSAPNAHPRLRLKQSLLASETKMDPAKGKINSESMGIHVASQCLSSP